MASNLVEDTVEWSEMDEKIRRAHDKMVKKSRKPAMWEYDPKGGVPRELANLDPSRFLTTRLEQILCTLPRDILVRLCSMLSARDFVHLSLTCRVLHWRIFTFCTCYASYSVKMRVHDDRIFADFWDRKKSIPPKEKYYLLDGSIDDEEEDDGFGDDISSRGETALIRQYDAEQEGHRGLLVYQPFCLRKPFLFETLELYLILPFYGKRYYDRCRPYILAVRGLARYLNLSIVYQCNFSEKPFFNFPDTNDFLKAINASYYNKIGVFSPNTFPDYLDIDINNTDIFVNCPYARQMDRVDINGGSVMLRLNPLFENRIGKYWTPMDDAIKNTLENFLMGSRNLDFHHYSSIEKDNNNKFPLLENLFEKFGEFEKFFYTQKGYFDYSHYLIWKKRIATENGGQLRIEIKKEAMNSFACVTIGKEEVFDDMVKKYVHQPSYREENIWWKMETAVEPDEAEELDVTVESEEEKQREPRRSDHSCASQ